MATGRLVFQQIVQVAGAFIPEPQKRRTAYWDSYSFTSRVMLNGSRRWSKGSPAHAAEAVLRIILLAALHASHCHGYRHHYTNSDANSARPFGIPTLAALNSRALLRLTGSETRSHMDSGAAHSAPAFTPRSAACYLKCTLRSN
jgi:hypothetical protein